jgi:hypothetical protein
VNRLDTDLELLNIVEGVKDAEDVDTILLCLVAEVINRVIREARIC